MNRMGLGLQINVHAYNVDCSGPQTCMGCRRRILAKAGGRVHSSDARVVIDENDSLSTEETEKYQLEASE